jgi:hypothetical protein
MNPQDVLDKTALGLREVRERTLGLPARLRGILIMVDGRATVERLQALAAQSGAPPDALEQLLAQELVVVREMPARPARAPRPPPPADAPAPVATPAPMVEADRLRAAQKHMNDSIVDALGMRALFFTLKIERCFSRDDLVALLPEYQRLMAKAAPAKAAAAEATLRELLR